MYRYGIYRCKGDCNNREKLMQYLLVGSMQAIKVAKGALGNPSLDGLRCIAVTSAGVLACEEEHLPYETIDQFSSRKELVELGWKNYTELDDFCDQFDALAQKICPSLNAHKIRPFKFAYYDLKILIDAITIKIVLLKNLLAQIDGEQIYYLRSAVKAIGAGSLLRPKEDVDIFALLLETVFCDGQALKADDSLAGGGPSRCRGITSQMVAIAVGIVRRVRQVCRLPFKSARRTFLVFDLGHDIAYILPELRRQKYAPVFVDMSETALVGENADEFGELWQTLCNESRFRQFFICEYHDYFGLAEPLIRAHIQGITPTAVSAYHQMSGLLRRYHPSFTLTGTINLGLVQRCRMLAAQHSGAPLITYIEGAGYGSFISPIYDHTEAVDGDVMLCYGEGNLEYYQNLGIQTRRMYPVGSVFQEDIDRRGAWRHAPSEITRIMYVGAVVFDNINHIPNCGFIGVAYLSSQLRILRMLKQLPKSVSVTVKPAPQDEILKRILSLAEFGELNAEMKPFTRVLEDADLFIIDYPSTVLLSAVATNAHIFVLIEEGVADLTNQQMERLEKRAYVFRSFEEMADSVRQITEFPERFPPRINDEYKQAYSTYRSDGLAVERAYAAICQTVAHYPQPTECMT